MCKLAGRRRAEVVRKLDLNVEKRHSRHGQRAEFHNEGMQHRGASLLVSASARALSISLFGSGPIREPGRRPCSAGGLMAPLVLLDELHIHVLIPRRLPEQDVRSAYQRLRQRRFLAELPQAIRNVFQSQPPLDPAWVRVAR
jgi:hypothetical protein